MRDSLRDRLRLAFLSTGWGYRIWVRRNFGGRLRPGRRPAWGLACAVLRNQEEIDRAVREAREIGLPFFGVEGKFWDALSAVKTVLETTAPAEEVLDAGAELYSPVLPWLSLYGYRRLTGCNLVFEKPRVHGPIVYERGDVTRTGYGEGRFSAVTCLSVIEHGVDAGRFFREMGRIIRPGGILVLSTDYWQDPIDTKGKMEFGAPVKVFCREEILSMLSTAAASGLRPVAPVDLECTDRVARWNDLEYTFLLLTFRKDGPCPPPP